MSKSPPNPFLENHLLFRRIDKTDRDRWNPEEHRPKPNAFKNSRDKAAPTKYGMSTDWSGRCDAEAARRRVEPTKQATSIVVSLLISDVCRIESQAPFYDPVPENDAHALVVGPKSESDWGQAWGLSETEWKSTARAQDKGLEVRKAFVRIAKLS